MSTTLTSNFTADELAAMPDDGYCYELVKGNLIRMSPPFFTHGRRAMALAAPLAVHVKAHNLGVICAAETGFVLTRNPDTVRAPDIAFISRQRVDRAGEVKGYWEGAPDLAVEVLSPDDYKPKVLAKVADWLNAGAQAVWVISHQGQTVTVHRADREPTVLTEHDVLGGDDLIPGFQMAVSEIFN